MTRSKSRRRSNARRSAPACWTRLLGQAATGTGKTAAFALPILQMIDKSSKVVPFALILVPTRELAMQVSEAIFRYGRELNVKVTPIYGGQPIFRQLQALDRGVHIVVATPGRALDHIVAGRSTSLLSDHHPDEAAMLAMGFADDIDSILQATPVERHTCVPSATSRRAPCVALKYHEIPSESRSGAAIRTRHRSRRRARTWQRSHKPARSVAFPSTSKRKGNVVLLRTRTEVDQLPRPDVLDSSRGVARRMDHPSAAAHGSLARYCRAVGATVSLHAARRRHPKHVVTRRPFPAEGASTESVVWVVPVSKARITLSELASTPLSPVES